MQIIEGHTVTWITVGEGLDRRPAWDCTCGKKSRAKLQRSRHTALYKHSVEVQAHVPVFDLEEDDEDMGRYHRIHVKGCSHLRDPERIGRCETIEAVLEQVSWLTDEFESVDEVRSALAPCAVKALR